MKSPFTNLGSNIDPDDARDLALNVKAARTIWQPIYAAVENLKMPEKIVIDEAVMKKILMPDKFNKLRESIK